MMAAGGEERDGSMRRQRLRGVTVGMRTVTETAKCNGIEKERRRGREKRMRVRTVGVDGEDTRTNEATMPSAALGIGDVSTSAMMMWFGGAALMTIPMTLRRSKRNKQGFVDRAVTIHITCHDSC